MVSSGISSSRSSNIGSLSDISSYSDSGVEDRLSAGEEEDVEPLFSRFGFRCRLLIIELGLGVDSRFSSVLFSLGSSCFLFRLMWVDWSGLSWLICVWSGILWLIWSVDEVGTSCKSCKVLRFDLVLAGSNVYCSRLASRLLQDGKNVWDAN